MVKEQYNFTGMASADGIGKLWFIAFFWGVLFWGWKY